MFYEHGCTLESTSAPGLNVGSYIVCRLLITSNVYMSHILTFPQIFVISQIVRDMTLLITCFSYLDGEAMLMEMQAIELPSQ